MTDARDTGGTHRVTLGDVSRWMLLGSALGVAVITHYNTPESREGVIISFVLATGFMVLWAVMFWVDKLGMRGLERGKPS